MNKILEIKFGSHLYATNTENSDLDLKSIYLPTAKEICLNSYKKTITTTRPKQLFERNKKDDVDIEIFSLDRYLQLLIEGQTVALDILFSPKNMFTYESESIWIFDYIFNNRFELLHKNITSFMGYAKNQAARYGLKGFRVHAFKEMIEWLNKFEPYYKLGNVIVNNELPKNEHIKTVNVKGPKGIDEPHLEVCNKKYPYHATIKYVKEQIQEKFDEYGQRALMAERNENIDWKALSHSVRVNSEAKELLQTGFITFPRPDKELLLNIKLGKLRYKEVAEIIENGLEELKIYEKTSTLRETPNKEWADNFLFEIYSNIVREDYELRQIKNIQF